MARLILHASPRSKGPPSALRQCRAVLYFSKRGPTSAQPSAPTQHANVIRRHTLADPNSQASNPVDNRRLANLCGPLDAHLRSIEQALDVALIRREASFRINGARESVDRAVQLLDHLFSLSRQPIGERALQLALLRAVSPEGAANDEADVVLHTRHTDLSGRTPNQTQYLQQIVKHDITFGIGPAGTGKTYLAVACAGERLGFLPGDLAQKVDPYLRPLYDALYDLMGFDRVTKAFDKGLIEVAPLAFMRGRTLNHAFVILDEAQNTTREQMKMFLTRIGFGSKCVVNGDISQIDLPKGVASGLVDAQEVLRDVKGIAFTQFNASDVVRHPLVARIVDAYEAARGNDDGGRGER
jgi:phosphate starvation-inducible protein PhoH and related proteins